MRRKSYEIERWDRDVGKNERHPVKLESSLGCRCEEE